MGGAVVLFVSITSLHIESLMDTKLIKQIKKIKLFYLVGGYGQGNPKAYIFLERSLSHINLCWDNSRINNNKTPSPVWWRISWEQSQKCSAKE